MNNPSIFYFFGKILIDVCYVALFKCYIPLSIFALYYFEHSYERFILILIVGISFTFHRFFLEALLYLPFIYKKNVKFKINIKQKKEFKKNRKIEVITYPLIYLVLIFYLFMNSYEVFYVIVYLIMIIFVDNRCKNINLIKMKKYILNKNKENEYLPIFTIFFYEFFIKDISSIKYLKKLIFNRILWHLFFFIFMLIFYYSEPLINYVYYFNYIIFMLFFNHMYLIIKDFFKLKSLNEIYN